ncbi:MAG: PEGA domain-containing protein [Polyangiaceae bacterium]
MLAPGLGCGSNATAGEVAKTPKSTLGTSDVLEESAPEEAAILDILSGNPTEIRIDGKKVGTTPITGFKVSPGTHEVTFVFTDEDTPTLGVTVGPGDSKTVKLDPPPGIREQGKPGDKTDKTDKTEKK